MVFTKVDPLDGDQITRLDNILTNFFNLGPFAGAFNDIPNKVKACSGIKLSYTNFYNTYGNPHQNFV